MNSSKKQQLVGLELLQICQLLCWKVVGPPIYRYHLKWNINLLFLHTTHNKHIQSLISTNYLLRGFNLIIKTHANNHTTHTHAHKHTHKHTYKQLATHTTYQTAYKNQTSFKAFLAYQYEFGLVKTRYSIWYHTTYDRQHSNTICVLRSFWPTKIKKNNYYFHSISHNI